MLTATSDSVIGESRMRSALAVERRFRVHLLWRNRLLFDSKFMTPAPTEAHTATIYVSLEGAFELAGQVIDGPVAVIADSAEFENKQPDTLTFRSWGDPAVVIELRVHR